MARVAVNLNDKVSEDVVAHVAGEAQAYAMSHGVLMGLKPDNQAEQNSQALAGHAPYTLLPSPFPRREFAAARDVQCSFNALVDAVSRDTAFLQETLREASDVDPFTKRMLGLLERVTRNGVTQPVALGVLRIDYMLHAPHGNVEAVHQVEINTIASAFAPLGSTTSAMHRFLLETVCPHDLRVPADALPHNPAIDGVPDGMAAAVRVYCERSASRSDWLGRDASVVLMVVQAGDSNAFDQRFLEYQLWQRHRVRVVRRTMAQVHSEATLAPSSKALLLQDGTLEVALVYYRAGYAPRDYPSDVEWDARTRMEDSLAIKCPSIAYHLAGTKKVQQVLAVPGALDRFLPAHHAQRLAEFFAGMYPLTAAQDDAAMAQALAKPHAYVLKPQREGGGNNFYNQDIVRKLQELTPRERTGFVLMDRIMPPAFTAHIMRGGAVAKVQAVSELGIFGTVLGDGSSLLLNEQVGHLLRSKNADKDDGGVAAGVAVLDSPMLV